MNISFEYVLFISKYTRIYVHGILVGLLECYQYHEYAVSLYMELIFIVVGSILKQYKY